MLQFLFELFIPPIHDSPESLRRHRMILSFGVVTLSFLMLAAFGYLPRFSGFAYASTVTDIKVELMEQRIFDNRIRQCTATTPESRQFYGEKASELMRRYRDLTGYIYQLPSCREIQ